jgi:hypothetical protein
MEELFTAFGKYIKVSEFNNFEFWIYPIGTIIAIWLFTTIGLKLIPKRKSKLKTVFRIHSFWICSALIIATVIISLFCFWWATNYFTEKPLQLSLLISLVIALMVPFIALLNLRSFFTNEDIKEISEQPKTPFQSEITITYTKKAFRKKKLCYILLLLGFLFLLFSLNTGKNIIAIVFDNSGSMSHDHAKSALAETLHKLDENNELILTTLDGSGYIPRNNAKMSVNDIMNVKNSNELFAGNVRTYNRPQEALNDVNSIIGFECCSPICESIWKTHLYIQETKQNSTYKNKLLIVITDGEDNYVSKTLSTESFFFENTDFSDYFMPENIFIIDFSQDNNNPFFNRFIDAGCEIYSVENNKQDYLNALNTALTNFSNDIYLLIWLIIFVILLSIFALLIQPKKIV